MNPFDLASLVGLVRILVGISIIAGIAWVSWALRAKRAGGFRKPRHDGGQPTTKATEPSAASPLLMVK